MRALINALLDAIEDDGMDAIGEWGDDALCTALDHLDADPQRYEGGEALRAAIQVEVDDRQAAWTEQRGELLYASSYGLGL